MSGISVKLRNGDHVLEEVTLQRSQPAREGREKSAGQRASHL